MVKLHNALILAITLSGVFSICIYADIENSNIHALTQRIKSYNECIYRTSKTEFYELCITTIRE